MEKPTTDQLIEALERARERLEAPAETTGYFMVPGSRQFICLALIAVRKESPEQHRRLKSACNRLTDVITKRLGEFSTLDSWLVANVPEANRLAGLPAFDFGVYRTRLAWLDSLIEEAKAGTL